MDRYREVKYQKEVEIIRKSKELGSASAGFIGLVQTILEVAEEVGFGDEIIGAEVKMVMKAYREVVGG